MAQNVPRNLYQMTRGSKAFMKRCILFWVIGIMILFFLLFFSFKKVYPLQGLYYCENETCFLDALVSYNIAKNLTQDEFLVVQKQTIPLKIREFKNLEKEGGEYVEEILFEIPKMSFFDYEPVEFHLVLQEKSLLSLFFDFFERG